MLADSSTCGTPKKAGEWRNNVKPCDNALKLACYVWIRSCCINCNELRAPARKAAELIRASVRCTLQVECHTIWVQSSRTPIKMLYLCHSPDGRLLHTAIADPVIHSGGNLAHLLAEPCLRWIRVCILSQLWQLQSRLLNIL